MSIRNKIASCITKVYLSAIVFCFTIKWVGSVGMVVSYYLFQGLYLMVFTGGKVGDFNGNVFYGRDVKMNDRYLVESVLSSEQNIHM